jgi:uncharacterized short protein YbdD (DUF466 family)
MGSCCSSKTEETDRREEEIEGLEMMDKFILEMKEAEPQARQLAREKFWLECKKDQEEKRKWGRARRAVGSGQWQ